MAPDFRLMLFDTKEPGFHLSSLEAIWRQVDRKSSPETVLIRRLDPCVLIGVSQEAPGAADVGYCRQQRIPVLRRPSQGGAVFLDHGCLVYSMVLSAASIKEATPNDLFDRFQLSMMKVLRSYNIPARPSYPNDITAGGRKIAGLTLTQWYSAYSLSGTLLVKLDESSMDRALGKKVSSSLTSVERELGQALDQNRLVDDLAVGLAGEFSCQLQKGGLSREEQNLAQYLMTAKYGNGNWNRAEA
jgi:lipoate---protein ligase